MKKIFFIILLLLIYVSIPFATVSHIYFTLVDQNGQPVTKDASATFFDKNEQIVHVVTVESLGSYDNNLKWRSYSKYPPDDVKSVQKAIIKADGCEEIIVPITPKQEYETFGFSLHGGMNTAYFSVGYEQSVRLNCNNSNQMP